MGSETRQKDDRRFREALKRELPAWESEGLLTAGQARALGQRYALSDLKEEHTGLLLAMIYGIGAVLIGGGVISFVAAHWEAIPKLVKVAMLLAAMLGAHIVGYRMWRVTGARPKLGHALVVLGTLIFGANIGLMAQIFHITSHFYNGFAAWAVGAGVVAYCLGSVPNAAIAIATSFVWYGGWTANHPDVFNWYPVALAAFGLPLAYRKQSGFVCFLVLLGFVVSAHITVGAVSEGIRPAVIAGVAISFALAAYGAFHTAAKPRAAFAGQAFAFSALVLAFWAYTLSFRAVGWEMDEWEWFRRAGLGVQAAILIGATFGAGLVLWKHCWGDVLRSKSLRPYVAGTWIGLFLVVAAVAIPWHGAPVTVLANLAFLLLGVGLIRSSVASRRRGVFWSGVVIIALLILSRFLEYDTGLLLKSLAFVVSGVGVLYGGMKFEKLRRQEEPAHE